MVSASNVAKLEELSSKQGTSAAEIVRQAIDAYDPDQPDLPAARELMDLVSMQLKDAIKSTRKANRKVADTLRTLSEEGA
jgi:hypothetical protein